MEKYSFSSTTRKIAKFSFLQLVLSLVIVAIHTREEEGKLFLVIISNKRKIFSLAYQKNVCTSEEFLNSHLISPCIFL